MLRHTTQLNRVGMALAQIDGVHAMTDVTGFGLAGHICWRSAGARNSARRWILARLPLIESAVHWAQAGVATGASGRNWAAYGTDVDWPAAAPEWQRTLLTDPQTSGGLLVSCAPEVADAVVRAFHGDGFAQAAISWAAWSRATHGRATGCGARGVGLIAQAPERPSCAPHSVRSDRFPGSP